MGLRLGTAWEQLAFKQSPDRYVGDHRLMLGEGAGRPNGNEFRIRGQVDEALYTLLKFEFLSSGQMGVH